VSDLSLLEQRYPRLRGRRLALGDWPTPVEALDVGAPEPLWVKREDVSAEMYGGNKVRKLEWLLPAAQRRGGAVVTVGAVGSNHVVATATYAQRCGLEVHAVLVPQPATASAARHAAVVGRLAHRVWPAEGEVSAGLALARAVRTAWQERGARPAIIWVGGTSPRGVLGWVDGGLEIAAQVREGLLPSPRHVFVPAGTGGLAAGLLVGLSIDGIDAAVHAVRVADHVWANRPLTLLHARRTVRLLRRHGADIDDPPSDRLEFHHRWFGHAYGVPSHAGERAARLAAAHGLDLEPTYTAKALAAALAHLRSAHERGPVLWVNTVNSRPVTALVDGPLSEPDARVARLLRPLPAPR
jgi:D-cysteine desulfhydrase